MLPTFTSKRAEHSVATPCFGAANVSNDVTVCRYILAALALPILFAALNFDDRVCTEFSPNISGEELTVRPVNLCPQPCCPRRPPCFWQGFIFGMPLKL